MVVDWGLWRRLTLVRSLGALWEVLLVAYVTRTVILLLLLSHVARAAMLLLLRMGKRRTVLLGVCAMPALWLGRGELRNRRHHLTWR